MAKAVAAQASDRFSQVLDGITGYAAPLLKGSRSDLIKRFGPFGLIAAAIGGGGYALKRYFSRTRPEPAANEAAPKAKKSKKAKSKK